MTAMRPSSLFSKCTLIYLVRHGQTTLNQADVLRGHAEAPLDRAGRDQARRLGAALGAVGLTAVITSPSLRARQTAEPIADRAGLKVAIDERFLDRDYRLWTCVSRAAVTARFGSVDAAPSVEPRAAVMDRAVKGITDIALRCQSGIAVVVGHDAVNRLLLGAFRPDLGDVDAIPQDNGCFNALQWHDDSFRVLTVNESPRGLC
jgi:broad specificity phosphatase PhoE